jgi:molybdate transport system ATP-binding protein
MPTALTLSVQIRSTRRRNRRSERGASHDAPFSLDVAFEVPSGITVLFGPSGSGKSTTLAAIAGLLRPDAGRIALGEEVWFDSERGIDRPPHQRGVAFVFQSLALFPHLTATQNVAYGIDRASTRRETQSRAAALLAKLEVSHLANRRPSTFSGGEAQRVALARAFATAPRVALFDEPFSALDLPLRNDLIADVRDFADELAIPLVHVTHERTDARALGERIILLADGRVIGSGSTRELLREQSLEGSRGGPTTD